MSKKCSSYEDWVCYRLCRGQRLHTKTLTRLPPYLDTLEGYPSVPQLEARLGKMRFTHHLGVDNRHWYSVDAPAPEPRKRKPPKVHPKQVALFGEP